MKLWADLYEADVQVRSVSDDEFAVRPMLVGVASEQNHKYSADLSAHVTRGKVEQKARGDRPGGPLNDGYVQRVLERDAKGKITKREYDFNPTRQPTIARLFELLLQDIPAERVAEALNREGHRTERGGYWKRNSIEDKATNAWYAGAVVWYRNNSDRDEEVFWDPPIPHPTYISRDDFDRLAAMRSSRDKATGSNRKPGRKHKRHLLADLVYCERCGEPMRCETASYTRVSDGTKGYSYVCRNVQDSTGMCDAPKVNGEVADLEVAEYLTGLFADGEDFLQRVGVQRDTEREEVEVNREREAKQVGRLRGEVVKLQRRYRDLIAEGKDARAEAVEGALTEARAEVEQAEHRVGELDAILAAAPDPTDAVLDLYAIVKAQVSDALGRPGVPEIRAGLADTFERFIIDTTDDGVRVRAFLRTDNVVGVERLAEPVGNRQDTQEYRCSKPKRLALAASQA